MLEMEETMSEFEELMTVREVKNILAVSPGVVIRMVQSGEIPAYKVTGSPVQREEVTQDTYGLRFKPSDIRDYLSKTIVS
jgi:excisionase family DNA binding protein